MITKLKDIVQFPDLIQDKNTYWKYLTPDFDAYLQNYLKVFESYRKETGAIPATEADWKLLPFGPFAKSSDWEWRRQSLAIIQDFTKNKNFDCILEIGPWNGWLTKSLAEKATTVIGADYFTYPFDGIGNIQSLSENIIAVQCNVNTIYQDFKGEKFDLIVLNHCLSYTENPVVFIQKLIPLLKEGGKIISLGNTFYRNSEQQISRVRQQDENFFKKYNLNLYLAPVKGYLDRKDKKAFNNLGFQIKSYPGKSLRNLYSKFEAKAPSYHYIVYHNY